MTAKLEGSMLASSGQGRGSNISEEERNKTGEHSHGGGSQNKSSEKGQGRASNLTEEDRRKGGEQAHKGSSKKE